MSRASSATSQARSSSAARSGRSHQSNASPNFLSQPHNSRQVRWGSDRVIERSQDIQEPPQLASTGDHDGEEEGLNGICLAISVVRGKLGCAYYDSNDNKIYFLGDQPDSSEFDLANLGTLDFSSPSSQSRQLTFLYTRRQCSDNSYRRTYSLPLQQIPLFSISSNRLSRLFRPLLPQLDHPLLLRFLLPTIVLLDSRFVQLVNSMLDKVVTHFHSLRSEKELGIESMKRTCKL